MFYDKILEQTDPEIKEVFELESERQQNNIELIASENIVSQAVLAIQGSLLTNKYAEGYPDRRYYGGCEYVDRAENLAIERAKQLFRAEYANVQPHSGSQANMAALFGMLKRDAKILSMDLAHGGHLTHGCPASFSGRFFNFCHYGVNRDTGTIDYEKVEQLAKEKRPDMIIAGASAYPREIDFKTFSKIAKSVGAYLMVDMAHIAGLVCTGIHQSPVPFADVVTTTTHKTLRGPRGGMILAKNIYGAKIDKEIFPGIQGGPLMHIIAAKAVSFKEAMSESFTKYQIQTVKNSKALAVNLKEAGLNLVSGGTDNHLILVDLRNMKITGKLAEKVLEKAGITANKNSVPFDDQGPNITSGIRFGTPAVTSRGMKTPQMAELAQLIVDVIKNPNSKNVIKNVKKKSLALCAAFPIYKELR